MARFTGLITISFCVLSTTIALLTACLPQSQGDHNFIEVRRSLFKIKTTSIEPDYQSPWLTLPPQNSTGSGFYIGYNHILTNAHVVSRATFIKVQREGFDRDVQARVVMIADDADLALLTVDEPHYFEEIPALDIGGIPNLQNSVITIGYPRGGEQLTVTQGVVSRLTHDYYSHSRKLRLPTIQIDSAINPGNSGGPVIQNGKVVGVAFQTQRGDSINYMIPTIIIRRVLEDFNDGVYDGIVDDGLRVATSSTETAAVRAFFGLDQFSPETRGVIVLEVPLWSPFYGAIQRNDILLKIDGKKIGSDGKISFYGEKLPFDTLIALKQMNEKVTFDILRDQKRLKLTLEITKEKPHLSYARHLNEQPYLVFGGLVFTPLNIDFMFSYGKDAKDYPFDLWYHLSNHDQIEDYRDRSEVIILRSVLNHKSNRAAMAFLDLVLDRVNQTKVKNLEHLKDLLTKETSTYLEITFWNIPGTLVIDRKEALQIQTKLLEQFQVARDYRAEGSK